MSTGDDFDLANMIEQVKALIQQRSNFPNAHVNAPIKPVSSGYQAPIKGTFYNSGDFSLTYTSASHPHGHQGTDLRAAAGTPIYPIAPGIITNVGTDVAGGNIINIDHANNVRSYYAHCSTVNVHKGDKVDNNTVIGTIGNSGNASSTFPHLHLQVWQNGQIQNPNKYFSIPKYSNLDKTKEKFWLSEEAKNNAKSFNMKEHLNSKVAFSKRVKILVKLCYDYNSLNK